MELLEFPSLEVLKKMCEYSTWGHGLMVNMVVMIDGFDDIKGVFWH